MASWFDENAPDGVNLGGDTPDGMRYTGGSPTFDEGGFDPALVGRPAPQAQGPATSAVDPYGADPFTVWTGQFQNPVGNAPTFQAAPGFNAPSFSAPQMGSLAQMASPQALQYTPYQAPSNFSFGQQTPNFQAPGQFTAPNTLQTPTTFQAPTLADVQQTPGYQFQLQQGLSAMQNSAAAKGELHDPNTLQALDQFAQGLAGTTYNNAYNQAYNTWSGNNQAQQAAQAQQYGQASNTYGLNANQTLADFHAQLAGQAQGYGQASNTYGLNAQNALNSYQTNLNAMLGIGQQNFAQDLSTNQFNTNNALNTFQANTGAQQNANQMNLSGMLAAYQGQLQQNAAQNAQNQWAYQTNYGNAANQYLQNYNQFQTNQANQFGRATTLDQLGQNAAALANQAGANYGANASGLYTGQGAANAAGQVGSANAWNSGLSGVANAAQNYAFGQYLVPKTSTPAASRSNSNPYALGADGNPIG